MSLYVIGNWKMNFNRREASLFLPNLISCLDGEDINNVNISISPPIIYLPEILAKYIQLKSNDKIDFLNSFFLTAQNISDYSKGAFTGQISAGMLSSYCNNVSRMSVLIGHSESRLYLHESDDMIKSKISNCLNECLYPVVCCGETKDNRKRGDYLEVVRKQLEPIIKNIPNGKLKFISFAYEPIWAIGTGENASPEQIDEIHNYIRTLLCSYFPIDLAFSVPLLYGGSCSKNNARDILLIKNVNGLLVGGASLDVEHFSKIIKIANELS